MTVERFWSDLLRRNGYRTPEDFRAGSLDRLLGRWDAWYHLRLLGVVAHSGWLARRRAFAPPLWGRQAYAVLRAVEDCGGRFQVDGVEHLKGLGGPAVYVANHMSMIETLLLPALLLPFGLLTLVVKESLLRYPVFGAVMRGIRPVSVTRRDPRQDLRDVLECGRRVVCEEGRSLVVFPQATRSVCFDPAAFNSLGCKLARAAGAPLVPLALRTDFHGIGRLLRDFGPVRRDQPLRFRFGPPLRVSGVGREEHERAAAFLSGTLAAWGIGPAGPVPGGGARDE
jgi:1-acyl-sn-glycerol-3-phosphate acyltransferase